MFCSFEINLREQGTSAKMAMSTYLTNLFVFFTKRSIGGPNPTCISGVPNTPACLLLSVPFEFEDHW